MENRNPRHAPHHLHHYNLYPHPSRQGQPQVRNAHRGTSVRNQSARNESQGVEDPTRATTGDPPVGGNPRHDNPTIQHPPRTYLRYVRSRRRMRIYPPVNEIEMKIERHPRPENWRTRNDRHNEQHISSLIKKFYEGGEIVKHDKEIQNRRAKERREKQVTERCNLRSNFE